MDSEKPAVTDAQKIRRLEFRCDWLEHHLTISIAALYAVTEREAQMIIAEEIEKAMTAKGIKYPLNPEDQ